MRDNYDIDWDDPELWTQPLTAGISELSKQGAMASAFSFYSNYEHHSQQAYGIKDPDESSLYMSPLREQHARADYDRVRETLDPGYNVFRDWKRSQAHNAESHEAQYRKLQRTLKYAADNVGVDWRELTPQQAKALLEAVEQSKQQRARNAQLVKYLTEVEGMSSSGAYKRLGGMTDEQKDGLQHRAQEAGYGYEDLKAEQPRPECQRATERATGPLPTSEPVRESRYPNHFIPDKAAIREQLARDTERFLAGGGEIEQMPYRGDPKPLPFNRW